MRREHQTVRIEPAYRTTHHSFPIHRLHLRHQFDDRDETTEDNLVPGRPVHPVVNTLERKYQLGLDLSLVTGQLLDSGTVVE